MKLKPFIALLGISYSLSYSAYADCAGLAFRLFRSSLPPSISSILLKSFPNHDKNVGIHKKQSYGTLLEKTALGYAFEVCNIYARIRTCLSSFFSCLPALCRMGAVSDRDYPLNHCRRYGCVSRAERRRENQRPVFGMDGCRHLYL